MLVVLPALDAALEAREPLRDIAQPSLDGPHASIQARDLPPEETADGEHGEGIDQYVHTRKIDGNGRQRQCPAAARAGEHAGAVVPEILSTQPAAARAEEHVSW